MTVQESHALDLIRRGAALWCDRLWWVLAGVLLAGGTVGAVRTYGVLGSVLLGCGLVLLACVTAYGVRFESGLTTGQVVRGASLGTVTALAVLGLLLLTPVAGSVAVAVLAVTSPSVVAGLVRLSHRWQPSKQSSEQALSGCGDQAAVDRAFAALVAQIRDEPR